MKISNETKVGALTAIAITLLILGYNFLKGRSLFKTGNFLYAKFTDVKSLKVSNSVCVNGFKVGSVYEIENEDANLKTILVGIKLNSNYNIPDNSTAAIADNPLGTPQIDINLGDTKVLLKSGDYIKSDTSLGLMGTISKQLTPIADNLKATLKTLDESLKNINSIFDPNSKVNLQSAIANIAKITDHLSQSSASLNRMMEKQNGSIAKSMDNVSSFTNNLAKQNEKISATLDNVKNTTENLSEADFKGTVNNLKAAIDNLNGVVAKLNSTNGSLGLLMNDKSLYHNLTNTVRSANILMDDLRTHPKRYVSLSVFGKKDKTGALQAPLEPSKP
jgi:phospholipid/cholesterol/gamma-HCH transport system substrate-binding protein